MLIYEELALLGSKTIPIKVKATIISDICSCSQLNWEGSVLRRHTAKNPS